WAAILAPGGCFAVVLRRQLGLEGLVVNVGLGWLVGGGAGLVLLRTALPEFRWMSPRGAFGHLGEVFRFGGPMQITNLLAVINLHLDKVLLTNFVSLAAV